MKRITRRQFLKTVATGTTMLALDQFLAACAQGQAVNPPTTEPLPASPTAGASSAAAPTPAEPTAEIRTPEATPAGIPDLVVARGGDPGEMVRRAIAALGGMSAFVPPGAKVVIKPNICVAYHSYEYAATTNPWVVGELVRLCQAAGAARVLVMDLPFGGSSEEAYRVSGIQEQVEAAGGKMVEMRSLKFVSTDLPKGKSIQKQEIYDDILKADVLIDVPIAKHHSLARLTLGMKNLMGVIASRSPMHQDLGQRLADLASRVYPALTVVDAVRILRANGPTGGSLEDVQKLDTVIASRDLVAADSFAAGLFGLHPEELDYIRAGVRMGLGRSDVKNLRIEEIPVGG